VHRSTVTPEGELGKKPILDDETFISEFESLGAAGIARKYQCLERGVKSRRRSLEAKLQITIASPYANRINYPGRVNVELKNGTILVGSDFHIWPEANSVCLRAFKKFIDDIKPDAIVLNGDVLDFPRISRYPQNWEKAPDPQEEIEASQDHLHDMVARSKRGSKKIWTIGNHDQRFENAIANALPQFRGVKGVHLSDHFGVWQKAMSCMVNYDNEPGRTMIKHRMAGGKHAIYNNVREAGCHSITGHLHMQNVRAVSDYRNFNVYGVDTGCVADKHHNAFVYTEDRALDWRSGFGLLTYHDWMLLPPELITKHDENTVVFRGQLITV
jgi:hypothetical protein